MLRLLAFAGLGLLIAGSSPALAQKRGKKDDGPRREGEYQGVKPGESGYKPKRTRYPRITWVGFIPKADGSSRFFVQLNQDAEYEQRLDDKGVLHLTVAGGRFAKRNTRRRLDTRFFDTAVATVRSKRARRRRARKGRPAQKSGVVLSFRFKTADDAQQAQASMSKAEDGYTYLYLDFSPAKERADDSGDSGEAEADDDLDE
ncbi:MAG: hypothetical protein KJO07_11485 [Deltaproteobacteria bacterium]|jgi:hypothetical protein|nr:hypothetical protein [Deltaproteobacteria bacterium]